MTSAITSFFVVLICGYFFRAIFSQSQKVPLEVEGKVLLKPVKIFYYFAFVSYAIALAVWALLLIDANMTTSGLKITAIISAVFLLSGIYLHLYSKRYFVEVSDDKILCQTWTGRRSEVMWEDIIATDFKNIASMELILKTKTNKVAIYMFVEGFDLVLDKLKQKVPPEVSKKAFAKLEKLKERRPDIFNSY